MDAVLKREDLLLTWLLRCRFPVRILAVSKYYMADVDWKKNSYFARKHATAYELTGWVRNTTEGKVSRGTTTLEHPTKSYNIR